MAMASTCAAMAAVTAAFSSPSAAVRCSTEPCVSSTSAVSRNTSVNFPLQQQLKTSAAEIVSASSSGSSGTGRPAILDPALQCANLLWFKGSYNTQIFVSEDEPADSVVRRFRKAVMQTGVIPECRRRRYFETPQDIAKRKLQASHRRNKSRRFTPRPEFGGEKKEGGGAPKASVDDDYWGYTDESS